MSIANELITRGWVQRSYVGPNGEVCLRGAAAAAYSDYEGDWEGVIPRHVGDALRVVLGMPEYSSLPGLIFNDADGRTFDEVLRVAKEADEILDALG